MLETIEVSRIKRFAANTAGRDLAVGDRFGKLVAIQQVESRGRAYWSFSCDCGETVEKPLSDVRAGKIRSCGCLRRDNAARTRKADDLTGEKFGRLKPLRLLDKSFGKSRWECVCDCGKTTVVAASELRKGSTVSCGCFRAERSSIGNSLDIKGQLFGRLTAISKISSSLYGVLWACECICGKPHAVLATDLSGGRVISCGCALIDKPGLRNPSLNRRSSIFNKARRIKLREAGGSFTPSQVAELLIKQKGRCASCNTRIKKYHRDHRTAVANGGNNDIHNIELLCASCNLRKSAKDDLAWANQNGRLL